MATYKLDGWDEDVDIYTLIGIHSTLQPYRMAYMLNKYLNVSFYRTELDQDITTTEYIAKYPLFKHTDLSYNTMFYLITNKYWATTKTTSLSGGLFNNETSESIKTVLIKEYAGADFILKIELDSELLPLKEIITDLTKIPQVISAYQLDDLTIKQKDYLIFE